MKEMLEKEKQQELMSFAADIRTQAIHMISKIGSGHVGGSLSIADLMACLYGGQMRIDPSNPRWEDRDRIVLSKGHAGPAMYAALALKGYFPMAMLDTLNQPPTNLPSHTDRQRTPGVDMTTGSLGQGASTAAGMALALKMQGKKDQYTYLILGDGESQEGQVWEMAFFAAAQKLNHLIAFLDYNGKQLDSSVEEIMGGDPQFEAKFEAFGWNVIKVDDGNDVAQIWTAIDEAKAYEGDKPTMIVLHTIKGKGWNYAMAQESCHSLGVTELLAAQAAEEFAKQRGE